MDLVFSWFADAGAWPEHPGSGCAVVDQEVVGPLRLLEHVETMLGLGRPDVSAVRRIAVYQRKVAAAGAKRFWSASFNLDPWSSTRELLGWRDELVEAGWRPGVGIERTRLADIAAAEEAGPALPFGRADRVRAVIDALGERPSLSLRSVRLVDDRSSLLAGWRALLEALERCGTLIEQLPEQAAASLEDGRLTLLTADTELAAAEALTAWLGAEPEGNEGLVFVLGNDTALLDYSLAKAGLPRLGWSAPSPHRALLQILPLAFALAWEPPDPNRLLDFLLLPISPLPRFVANPLANVVAESPGIGGEDWIAAWAKIEKALAEEADADPKVNAKRLDEWRAFVEPERHDPTKGMPWAVAKEIAGRVAAWAVKRASAADDPLLERMVEQAIDVGVSDPTAVAEAAPWRAVSHPGGAWGDAKSIVWWHFADVGEAGATTVWNVLERAALSEAGCPLDEPGLELNRLASAWERPSRHARDRLLPIRPTLASGAETAAHPLWHALVPPLPPFQNHKTTQTLRLRFMADSTMTTS